MNLYKNWFITEMLRDALQSGANSTSKVTFKRMVASSDVVSDKDFPGLTNASMQTIKANQTVLISSTATKGNVVTITSVFNNFKNMADYKMNTIYLVAEYNSREFLAAITSANEPYTMPAESKTEHAEYTFKAQIGISNTDQVDLNMDPEAVATNEQLIAIEKAGKDVDKLHDERLIELEKNDSGNVKLNGDQQVYGKKTFIERIAGTINRALAAVKLETARKINGVLFDGSKDITIYAPTERTKLRVGANLNDIREEGLYHVVDNTRAMTIVNNPYDGDTPSFYLTVFEADGYVRQETWHYFQNNWRFARTFSNSENKWREWERVGS